MTSIATIPDAVPTTRAAHAVLGAVTTTIASVVPVFLVGGLAVQIADELRFSTAGLGLAVSVYFGVSALASVPAGRLVERYGPAVTARAAILLATASLLVMAAAARSFTLLTVILAGSAAANALGQLASNATLATRVPARRQGLSFGVKQCAIPVSTLLAGASVPTVALTFGWRWAFVAVAGLTSAALPLVPADAPPGPDQVRRGLRAARQPSQAVAALVVVGLAAALAAGAGSSLSTFLVDSSVTRGLAPGLAGLTLTLGSVVCLAGRLTGGWLADLRPTGHVTGLAAVLVVGAVGLSLLALPGAVALVTGVLLGFGIGWTWPGVMNFAVVQLNPSAPAAATSITQTGVYAGGCAGPLAFGQVVSHAGYPQAWLATAVGLLCAAGLMLLARHMLATQRAEEVSWSGRQ